MKPRVPIGPRDDDVSPGVRTVRSRRLIAVAVTALSLAAIGIATLRPGDAPETALCILCVPTGSRVGVDLVLNILLFVPYGIGLRAMRFRWPAAVAAIVVTSLAIELLQVDVVTGRHPSAADVVTNVAGGSIGFALAHRWRLFLASGNIAARRLAVAGLAAWVALIVVSAIAATPSFGDGRYLVRWRPSGTSAVRREGRILAARVDGGPLPPTPSPSDDPNLDGLRLGQPTRLDVSLLPSDSRGRDVRLELESEGGTTSMWLGQNGNDLILRVRLRAAEARLRAPTLRLTNALAAIDRPTEDTVALTADVSRQRLRLSSLVAGRRSETELTLGAHLGWSFLLPGRLTLSPFTRRIADALWLSFLLAPVAYWTRRSTRAGHHAVERGARLRALVALAACVAIGLAVVPTLLHVAPIPALGWVGSVVCVLAGWTVGGPSSGARSFGFSTMRRKLRWMFRYPQT